MNKIHAMKPHEIPFGNPNGNPFWQSNGIFVKECKTKFQTLISIVRLPKKDVIPLATRAIQEIQYSDLVRKPLTEILYRDLLKRTEILLRDLLLRAYPGIFLRDLLQRSSVEISYIKTPCTDNQSCKGILHNRPRSSCARSSTEIFKKGTCRIEPGISSARDHLE